MKTTMSAGGFAKMLTMMPLGRPGFPDEIATAAVVPSI
jgi:hypothetical protein